ncbi:hypothetical protein [Fodinibius sp.]
MDSVGQLYHLDGDLFEINNLSMEHPEVAEWLQTRLRALDE